MPQLSEKQILLMFRDFGLGTEVERERLRALMTLGGIEPPVQNFVKIDDRSEGNPPGEPDAKLA